ncbi:hypothetical protein Tco_0700694 [Tanacetum coccineum]
MAQRLQEEEQEELSVEEKAKLFQQLLEKRRKDFAATSAEEKRNKLPTQAQQRKIMCTYLKNMEGKKPKDLKNKSIDSIQKMFDRGFKRVNTFIDFRTDLVEGSSKRTGEELEQKSTKKQKKIHKEGKKSYYQIIRANGKSQMYRIFSQMIKSFDREDLEDLYKLVKAKYGSTRPVEDMDLLLWNDMKIMFKPHVEDEVWKLKNGYKVLEWKLYDSCGVHFLRMQSMQIYMLYKVNAAKGVNVASEEVSTAYVKKNKDDKGISICQEIYTRDLLKKYEISDISSVKTPIVPPNNLGPDISSKPAKPKESHLTVVKRIFEYVKGTPTLGPWYPKCSGFDLKGYSDCAWTGTVLQVHVIGFEESWCCANILWMKSQLSDYDIQYKMVPIFCDNTSAFSISKNPVLHSRTKHIDIRYHFIRDHIIKGDIELYFILTEYQLDDIFTKPLDEPTFT